MSNLKDLIELAKLDGGKFFVVNEEGEAKLVIMGIEEYQKMLLGKLKKQVMDVEKINEKITKAQLEEADEPEVKPIVKHKSFSQDLRSEVIDPSFDFEGPKIDLEDI